MSDQVRLTINRNINRARQTDLERLNSTPTGWVVDALGRKGALPHWIGPVSTSTRFVGSALTVSTRPLDNLAPYAALKFARPGDVLVVAVDEDQTASVMGDVLIGMAKNAGIVGVVTDGLVRDVKGINEVGIPVFARALSPNSPFKDGPGKVGHPVVLGGETINAGDIIVGDEDGVVVIPSTLTADVIHSLTAIEEKELKMEKAVTDGDTYPGWLDEFLASDQVIYTD